MTSLRDRKRCVFSKDESILIINLWKDDKIQNKFKSTLKHNFIWEQLSRQLSEFGYIKTGDEIKRKIQNLKHEYKAMKQISGTLLKAWPYYNSMKDLMERKITEKSNVHVEDDHDYVENEIHEIDEQSSSGSWMLMELKDISHANSDNFQEVEDTINTIAEEHLEESDVPSNVDMMDDKSTIKVKQKKESVLKNPLPIFSQRKVEDLVPEKTLPVRRSRRPFRFKTHPDRRILRTSYSNPHVTENRVMERIDERERRINEREARLEERERRIDDRERRIDERERRLEESERYLRERERRIEDRDKKNEERETNSSTAMCRFFDTCAQFLNQYTSPVINQTCQVDATQNF